MLAALASQKPFPPSPFPKLRPIPIILDRGDAAAVVLLHLPAPPRRGFTFLAYGKRWVVVREADHCRGTVAHPLAAR